MFHDMRRCGCVYLHLGCPALEEEMRERHSVVKRIVDMIVTRVGKQAELESNEDDFDDLHNELVGQSAMRKFHRFLKCSCCSNMYTLAALPPFSLPFLDGIHKEKLESSSHFLLVDERHGIGVRSRGNWRLLEIELRLSFVVCVVPVHRSWIFMLVVVFSSSSIFRSSTFLCPLGLTFAFAV